MKNKTLTELIDEYYNTDSLQQKELVEVEILARCLNFIKTKAKIHKECKDDYIGNWINWDVNYYCIETIDDYRILLAHRPTCYAEDDDFVSFDVEDIENFDEVNYRKSLLNENISILERAIEKRKNELEEKEDELQRLKSLV